MPACIIKCCQRTSRGKRTDKPRFHVFPPVKNPKFPLWLSAIGMSASEFSFVPSWRRYICSNHFTDDSYKWHLLNIPLGNRKLREDAVPNLLLLTTEDAESGSVESEESSSESEYATEFESESDYESEYESLSTSEFSFDLNEEMTVTNHVITTRTAADILDIGQSNVDLPRREKAQKQVQTASVDPSPFGWTTSRYPHGRGCWSKVRDAVTQSDNRLCLLERRVDATSPVPKSIIGDNQEVQFSQDLIRSFNLDHRYSKQAKAAYFRSRVSREYLEIASIEGGCPATQILATARGNSEDSSIYSTLSSPRAASDKDSTYEPGSDVESIASLDIDSTESIDDFATPNESLVFLNESGEFLDTSMIVEEPISDNDDNYDTLGNSRDNDALFHKSCATYNESIYLRDGHKLSFIENQSSVIKSEFGNSLPDTSNNMPFQNMDVDNSAASKFGDLVNGKMEVNCNCNVDFGEAVRSADAEVPDKENEFSSIRIKSESIDPVDVDQDNMLNENRYVVYESCLRELLKRCLQCGATVHNPLFNYQGSLLLVTMICTDGHRIIWKSRPEMPFQFTDVFGELT